MSTESLRRDHDLIERVLRSMATAVRMLEAGKRVPEPVLRQTVDFAKNFTDVCHHTKEEESLFPALESSGMPANMGPIAVMLMEHRRARELAAMMESGVQGYAGSGDASALLDPMRRYVQHLGEHLWKENNRLFVMAEARLGGVSSRVAGEMDDIERAQMEKIGRDRAHYEKIAADIEGALDSRSG